MARRPRSLSAGGGLVSRTLEPRSRQGLSLQGPTGRWAMSLRVRSAGVIVMIRSVDGSQRASGGEEWAVGFGAKIEELLFAAS